MDTQWIVTEIDGKVASISADYGPFARIAARIAGLGPAAADRISTRKITTEELVEWKKTVRWEDFRLFGSKFQLKVWQQLFALEPRLYSYSDLAALCDNPQGVRAVAHAVAVNPVAYLIPCHLIIPKESLDKARQIRVTAQSTLFKGSDLYLLDTIDVGEYAYGAKRKRELIKRNLQ